MAEKDTIFSGKIKHKGMFGFKDFYSFAYDWLCEESYNVTEKSYSEEITGDSKKVEIEWEAKKKISDYFRFLMKISWKVLNLKEVEIVKEGKKVKTNSAQVEIKIKGIIVKDYDSRWENNPFAKFMRGVYDRYVIKSRIDEYEDKIKSESDEFVDQCKAFLALEAKR